MIDRLPALSDLIEELHTAMKLPGPYVPARFEAAQRWLGLPRYSSLPRDDALTLLADDLKEAIIGLPKAEHSSLLAVCFNFDGQCPSGQFGKKLAAANKLLGFSVDDLRQKKLPAAESELTFVAFARATGILANLLQPNGYRITKADFHVRPEANQLDVRIIEMKVAIKTTRDDVSMFLWRWTTEEGVVLVGNPVCESKGHQFVGHVPYARDREFGDRLLCTYIGSGHSLGYETTVCLTITSQHPQGKAPSHIVYTPDPEEDAVALSADMPPVIAGSYRRAEYPSSSSLLPRPATAQWKARKGRERLEWPIPSPDPTVRYALEWKP